MLANQYPGVQIKEIPSGARPIASISTSNTVFIDVFKRGPLDKAVRLTSLADFEEIFGGLWEESEASYAIRQFFLNGGNVAFVIRVAAKDEDPADGIDPDLKASAITIKNNLDQSAAAAKNILTVTALEEGSWGDDLRVGIGTIDDKTYDLMIRLYKGSKVIAEETYQQISTAAGTSDTRSAESLINGVSKLVTVSVDTDAALTGADRLPKQGTPSVAGPPPVAAVEYALADLADLRKSDFHALAGGKDGYVPSVSGWDDAIAAAIEGSASSRTGLHALENIVPDIFNMMCLPVASLMSESNAVRTYVAAEKFCRDKFAFLFVDPAAKNGSTVLDHSNVQSQWFAKMQSAQSRNTAGYFPRLTFDDPENPGTSRTIGPSGMIAGMTARIDSTRGIWKSAAGTETRFGGGAPAHILTDLEQEPLNRLGINALRTFPVYGNIIWGARTLVGADSLADEYKYVAVRRTALFIQQSLQKGLKWTTFEGNDEKLWGQIRMNVKAFMQGLHRQGAFQGKAADDAYLVKCDGETTTQADIDLGIVNILVAFAPLKPAEFVVLNFKQLTKLPE